MPALDFEAILEGDCDGVVIAAPAPLHASLSQKAFSAGKHVYVEKPLAMTLDEADAMIEAAAQANRQLMVGHLLQYHPVFARFTRYGEPGRIGCIAICLFQSLVIGQN